MKSTKKPLILASASPRRRELLKKIGIPFKVDPAHLKENLTLRMPPVELARFWSFKKAEEVAKRHPGHLILGADTIVVVDGQCFGKPRTKKEALAMLRALNGKIHQVITGFTLLDSDKGRALTHAVATFVRFKKNPIKTLQNYIKTGEPMDKAGAYAIQGKGAALIDHIEGSRSNVVGLPVEEVKEAIFHFFLKRGQKIFSTCREFRESIDGVQRVDLTLFQVSLLSITPRNGRKHQ